MTTMRATDTLKKLLGPTQDVAVASPDVTIRYARPDDALALLDLADLDSSAAPGGGRASAGAIATGKSSTRCSCGRAGTSRN